MKSIAVALSWEYFARNRWMLLLYLLLPNALAWMLLSSLLSAGVPSDAEVYRPMHLTLVFGMAAILCYGVASGLGRPSRLYLMPVSTTKIVNYFFWGGALLIVIQSTLILGFWKAVFNSNWPIACPVLFASICWAICGATFIVPPRSLLSFATPYLIYPGIAAWAIYRSGGSLKQELSVQGGQVDYWSMISEVDVLISIAVFSTCYLLALSRISRDRGGHHPIMYWERFMDFLKDFSERIELPRIFSTPKLTSAIHAQAWYDTYSRTSLLPFLGIAYLPVLRMLEFASPTAAINPEREFQIACWYISSIAILHILAVLSVAILGLRGHSLQIAKLERDLSKIGLSGSGPFGLSPYWLTMPISTPQMATAMLRSSAWACGLSSSVLFASFVLTKITVGTVGDKIDLRHFGGIEIDYWTYVFVFTGVYLLLSFILINLPCAIARGALKFEFWTTPIIISLVLVASCTSEFLLLAASLSAVSLAVLAYSMYRAWKYEDMSLGRASLVFLVGAACAAGLILGWPKELGTELLVLALILLPLATLPFFSTASAIRYLRTN